MAFSFKLLECIYQVCVEPINYDDIWMHMNYKFSLTLPRTSF
jgi:hypothetical protein